MENKHGKGKKVNKGGSYFEGTYEDNTPVDGHYKWPDGMEYNGQWKNGKFHGKGMKINPNGTKYEGEWIFGKPQGKGKLSYTDGSQYEGFLVNGLFNGLGTKTFGDGAFYKGTWKDGELKIGVFK